MRPTFLILLAVLVLFVVQAIQTDRGVSPSRAVAESQTASLELAVSPAAPTSADIVEIHWGGGSGTPEQALRVAGSNQFFIEVLEAPTQATYILGALAPGVYTFSLFRQLPGVPSCRHELLGELHFTVKPAGQTGSGLLVLWLRGLDREGARALVEREGPQVDWLLERTAVLHLIPGLEESYRQLLQGRPEVEAVELNSIGFIPECPPPLGPAIAPGAVLVSFREGIERAQAEGLLGRLPPEIEAFRGVSLLSWEMPFASARVGVPQGWEQLFLRRYQRYPEVFHGRVVAPSSSSVQQGG
jgi:hypothetical protein